MKEIGQTLYVIIAVATAVIGYHIHGNGLYAVINFITWPISWVYWLICHDVNITVIKETFQFFLT